MGLLNEQISVLSDEVIITLADCVRNGLSKDAMFAAHPGLFKGVLAHIKASRSVSVAFYGNILLDSVHNCSPDILCDGKLNASHGTSGIVLSADQLSCRNESWTFESIRGTKGVSQTGKYAFSVIIESVGVIQVGWATKSCNFDPESGQGVGDDNQSYSIDGLRAKKWHANQTINVSSPVLTNLESVW